ncbi:DUF605-domain-containing protein [Neolentinus lepideus HHB14362 ss-1]|uniref:DUF605-domain-containing protein n=1 Tax=Neolentinus lepideus HHB14362 ss-1 TaxID=1314782 RepID=A0A165WAB8_9AGAM|nr:DUF605-domain-containing protein [Neolentinus lepideus HHB14362 ss-1]
MSASSYLGLVPVPAELKSIASYIQRADELTSRDPIMSYWCAYAAAQTGISLKSKATPARTYLFSLLSLLERMKSDVVSTLGKSGGADAVEDEAASAAYVENFALRVFESADSEDRKGQATRATAKKFLAAANFLEMLKIFDKNVIPDSHDEKIRYAKWKAADIAKAFREGRKPTPGPADSKSSEVEVEVEATSPSLPPFSPSTTQTAPSTSTSPKLSASSPPRSPKSVSPTSPSRTPRKTPSPKINSRDIQRANAISPLTEPSTYSYPVPHSYIPKHLHETRPGSPAWSTVATPGSDLTVRWDPSAKSTLSAPPQPQGSGDLAKSELGDNAAYPSETIGVDGQSNLLGGQPSSSPAPTTPPTPKKVHFTPSITGGLTESDVGSTLYNLDEQQATATGLAVPPPGVVAGESTIPAAAVDGIPLPPEFPPKNVVPTQSSPTSPSHHIPVSPSRAHPPVPPPPILPSARPILPISPSQLPTVTARFPAPPPPVLPSAPSQPDPVDLSPAAITQTQKHCRYAISALDYEDVETAKKELKIALGMLGGL